MFDYDARMPSTVIGSVTLFFLFDVSDAISPSAVRELIDATVPARLTPKPTTPAYVQYHQPPIAIDGGLIGLAETEGFRVRFKTFEYGVVSVALTRPFAADWPQFVDEGLGLHENATLTAAAERSYRSLIERLQPAIRRPRTTFLAEDYIVFTATRIDDATSAEALLQTHGADIAQLLRGERQALSAQEREEVLRHRLSYFTDDLVIPSWSGAFVSDTESGAQAALEILEFANSQLLEFRYYDGLLDAELERIYAQLQTSRWRHNWVGRRYTRAARQVHSLFIDVTELTDKTENTLKIAGDVYAARLFALTAARLGLDQWKANVREKLETLDDIYRFAVEQAAMTRGQFLELTIVLILVFELVLILAGVMK